jgi:pilus assembly protein CpaB
MSGGRILVVIGAVILVLAVVVVVVMMVRGRSQPAEPTPGPEEGTPVVYVPEGTVDIVVAAQNIPRGVRITADNNAVVLASWQENSVPAGTLTTLESAYGRIARLDIPLGMPILETMLTAAPGDLADVGSDAALLIPRGKVAYAVAVAGNASVAWAIQPGDHVDVLISLLVVDLDEDFQSQLPNQASCIGTTEGCTSGTMGRLEVLATGDVVNVTPGEAQRPRMITQLTVQNALVLRVGNWQGEAEVPSTQEEQPPAEGEEAAQPTPVPRFLPKWVTLAVTTQDALVLKYAEEAGASMDMVLRSAGDESSIATEPVTLQYVFDRFNMQLPPKLPYGTTPPVTQLRLGAAGEVILERGLDIEYSRQHQVTLESTGTSPAPQ